MVKVFGTSEILWRKKMIEIVGLTPRQKILADIIWSIEEWDQVEIFIASLSKKDRIDCEGILELIKMSVIEEFSERVDCTEAKELIERIKWLISF